MVKHTFDKRKRQEKNSKNLKTKRNYSKVVTEIWIVGTRKGISGQTSTPQKDTLESSTYTDALEKSSSHGICVLRTKLEYWGQILWLNDYKLSTQQVWHPINHHKEREKLSAIGFKQPMVVYFKKTMKNHHVQLRTELQ